MSSSTKRKAPSAAPSSASKKSRAITSFFTPQSSPVSKFDKKAWVAKLTPEEKELLKLEIDTLHESWLGALQDELRSREFLSLKRFLKQENDSGKKIYPPAGDIYSWSRHTPLDTVKVVILGQDPYHGPNQAMGLSFSVRPPTPAPPSLKNMYIALKNDYPSFSPPPNNGGLLTPWADRGVLMLNACLTVRASEANSHQGKGWEKLTQRAIDVISQKRARGVVFMAWGTPAGKRVTKVDKQKHLVLTSVHPSPLSAHKGFFQCGHFKKANEWLEARYGPDGPIDWNLHTPAAPKKSAAPAKETFPPPVEREDPGKLGEDDFDDDDEDAMIQAAIEAENSAKQSSAEDRDAANLTQETIEVKTEPSSHVDDQQNAEEDKPDVDSAGMEGPGQDGEQAAAGQDAAEGEKEKGADVESVGVEGPGQDGEHTAAGQDAAEGETEKGAD